MGVLLAYLSQVLRDILHSTKCYALSKLRLQIVCDETVEQFRCRRTAER